MIEYALVPQALYSSKATATTYRINLGETALSEGNIALSKGRFPLFAETTGSELASTR